MFGVHYWYFDERERQTDQQTGRSRQDKKRNEEKKEERKKERKKEERRKKKNATHHELAVGYHCQRAIETRRSRLDD